MMPERNVRLTQPYVRENGGYRPATWDEALNRVAEGFKWTKETHGPQSIGIFSCSKSTNELNFLVQKFARAVLGTNNVDSYNRTCHAPSVVSLATVFGLGGGTSSYGEIEETDVVLLWGSNARETHPIFFHHLLKGLKRGAKLYVIDSRRTSSAQWADGWLGLDVGSDIALAHAMGREIIAADLVHREFVGRATSYFEEYKAAVEPYTLEYAEKETGVPASVIRETAHAYARAPRAQICWTLGISEYRHAVNNVMALINLALLTGHVGRYGSGLNPLRGQNNVQGGGDMGALPDRLPGFQHVENDELRAKFEQAWGVRIPSRRGLNLSGMFAAMERGELRALYVIGENPAQSEADQDRAIHLFKSLDFLVVQDILFSATAELADVILPAAAGWCESEGTVTSSERRVQRVRRALTPPLGARDDIDIICQLAQRFGCDWGRPSSEAIWNELRSLSPIHSGMSYSRLEALGGIRWPCYSEDDPGEVFLHSRLWQSPLVGPPAPFQIVPYQPPVERLDKDYPIRLATGRRPDTYNAGIYNNGNGSPLRRKEILDISPEDGHKLGVIEGEVVKVISRHGELLAQVHFDTSLRLGLAFMTMHALDPSATNHLTIDAVTSDSTIAEFRAAAVRVEKLNVVMAH
jgi:formate dehydrogenase alpha subunit